MIAEWFRTDEGVLATPALVNNRSKNLSPFSEVTFPDICNYLLGKADEYSVENPSQVIQEPHWVSVVYRWACYGLENT